MRRLVLTPVGVCVVCVLFVVCVVCSECVACVACVVCVTCVVWVVCVLVLYICVVVVLYTHAVLVSNIHADVSPYTYPPPIHTQWSRLFKYWKQRQKMMNQEGRDPWRGGGEGGAKFCLVKLD